MITKYLKFAYVGALALALAVAFLYYRKAKQLELEISGIQVVANAKVAAAEQKARETEGRLQSKVSEVDRKWSKELKDARDEAQKRIDAALSGRERVYVRARCPSPASVPPAASGPSVDNGTTAAELDPEVAAELLAIARDGDEAIIALTAAQEIIRQMSILLEDPSSHRQDLKYTPNPETSESHR